MITDQKLRIALAGPGTPSPVEKTIRLNWRHLAAILASSRIRLHSLMSAILINIPSLGLPLLDYEGYPELLAINKRSSGCLSFETTQLNCLKINKNSTFLWPQCQNPELTYYVHN